jgi:hypothetical protein
LQLWWQLRLPRRLLGTSLLRGSLLLRLAFLHLLLSTFEVLLALLFACLTVL